MGLLNMQKGDGVGSPNDKSPHLGKFAYRQSGQPKPYLALIAPLPGSLVFSCQGLKLNLYLPSTAHQAMTESHLLNLTWQ